jgi:DNA repair photolyase
MSEYIDSPCASAMHRLKRKTPYGWDLNIYKGCAHGCAYCYALYSHPDLLANGVSAARDTDAAVFSGRIHVKTNIVERLERELSAPCWKREVVNIGGVTDSYQAAEAHYRFMPEILALLVKYRTPAIISTKSTLMLRDIDLIDRLSRVASVNIASTITTMDESVRAIIEPGASPSLSRFRMLREFRKTGATVGLHIMPVIPFLTDSRENLEALYALAHEADVHYVLPGSLYLRGKTKPAFLAAMQKNYPDAYVRLRVMYRAGRADDAWKSGLYATIRDLHAKYVLATWSPPKEPPPETPVQGELF